jgi:hypothetical protein
VSSEDGRVACVAELGEWLPMAHDGGVVHARERSTDHFYRHDDIPFAATAPRQGARSKALSIRAHGSEWGGPVAVHPALACVARGCMCSLGSSRGSPAPKGGPAAWWARMTSKQRPVRTPRRRRMAAEPTLAHSSAL